MRTLYIASLLLLSNMVQAQSRQLSNKAVVSKDLSKFIPNGYTAFDTIIGDLNLDKYQDLILVLKVAGEDTTEYPWENKRAIILLTANSHKEYEMAARNDNILFTYDPSNPFGEPYQGIKITNGVFKITQANGGVSSASEEEITFKFSLKDKNWYLHKVVEESWNRNRTQKGIEKANNESKTYTIKKFGLISFKKYKDWRL